MCSSDLRGVGGGDTSVGHRPKVYESSDADRLYLTGHRTPVEADYGDEAMDRPDSIIQRLIDASTRPTGVRFVGQSVQPAEGDAYVPWSELHSDALVVAASLQARGLVPGDHVAILGPTSRALITAIRGCWLAGCASMVLPLPMRMASLDSFIDSTRGRIRHGEAKLLLIDDLFADFYTASADDPPIEPLSAVLPRSASAADASQWQRPVDDEERLVILQYTSGSTSEPKGVMIPDRVLRANIDASCAAAELGPSEVMVSWLPLYHDMEIGRAHV